MKRIAFTILALLLTFAPASRACPMCKDSIANKEGDHASLHNSYNSNGQNISTGMNNSVYFMLGGLFLVMGMVGTIIIKSIGTPKN